MEETYYQILRFDAAEQEWVRHIPYRFPTLAMAKTAAKNFGRTDLRVGRVTVSVEIL